MRELVRLLNQMMHQFWAYGASSYAKRGEIFLSFSYFPALVPLSRIFQDGAQARALAFLEFFFVAAKIFSVFTIFSPWSDLYL